MRLFQDRARAAEPSPREGTVGNAANQTPKVAASAPVPERQDESMSVHIQGLAVRCIIGTRAWERKRKQRVVLDIAFEADLRLAAASDDIRDAVDYKDLKDRVRKHVASSQYNLLEALAGSVADLALADARIRCVDVTVEKPGALSGARTVAVRLRRRRPE